MKSDIAWIGNKDEPQAAAGFINSKTDMQGVMVIVRNKNETYSLRAFGDFTVIDAAAVSALLGFQAASQMLEG